MMKLKLEILVHHYLKYEYLKHIWVNAMELILLEVIILLDQKSIFLKISQKQALIVNKLNYNIVLVFT